MPKAHWANADVLRRRAEEALKANGSRSGAAHMAHARLVHELEVHATELEMQNEALREAQRELEASRAEYRSLFELAPVAYVAIADGGRIQAANVAASELFGMERDELIGIRLSRFVSEAEATAFELHQREVIGSTGRIRAQFTIERRDGTSRNVTFESQCTNPLLGEWRAGLLDSTEATLLARQVERTERLGVLGAHASGIVHDFKNILSTVLTAAEIALRSVEPEHPARRPMERLKQATLRGGIVVTQLLAYARDEQADPPIIQLNEVIASLEPVLRAQIAKGTKLVFALAASNPSVRAHAEQIEQALMNLVSNAQHAMPAGGTLRITTENVEIQADGPAALAQGRYVVIRVTDTGIGMEEKTAAHAFDPFFTTKPSGRGSGLGLAMVQGLAHRAGGHAIIESEIGRGTTVSVFLPQASGYLRTPSERPPISEPLPPELVVVVVSDDRVAREAARDYFRTIGCHAAEASNGFEALRVLKKNRDWLVVLLVDTDLPNLQRPEFASAARAIVPPVRIAFTPVGSDQPRAETEETGPVSRSYYATLYDAVVSALSESP